jgi:hypothetical protein
LIRLQWAVEYIYTSDLVPTKKAVTPQAGIYTKVLTPLILYTLLSRENWRVKFRVDASMSM